ncbi:MAG: M23 family metallopeptidase [bacterium]
MTRRPLTLMVIPEAGGKTASFRFPLYALYMIGVLVLGAAIASGIFVKSRVESAVHASAIELQMAENRVLKEKIESFTAELALLRARMETLRSLERQVDMLIDVEQTEQDLSPTVKGSSPGWRSESDDEITARVDLLLERVGMRRVSLIEILRCVGEQKYVVEHTPSIRPASGWVIAGYGYIKNPLTGRMEMHEGVDIAALKGTPIYATGGGRVSFVGYKPGYGLLVKINHGRGVSTWYGHCSMAKVRTGELVRRGAVIATIGKTGQAMGPHVRYEVRVSGEPVDPVDYFLDGSGYVF